MFSLLLASILSLQMGLPSAICGTGADIGNTAGDEMKKLYRGEKVTDWEGLKAYTGERAAEAIVGKIRQQAYLFNYRQLEANYGENVEFQLRREQVILCPQTVDFLYSKFTPLKVRYRPGSRPALEKVVNDVTAGCTTDREKALALMRFCRDLYKRGNWDKRPFSEYIYGGTEEQLIEKGEQLCECLGRLYVALCEIAGIPGRIVMHDIGGHITSEVYVDGHWAYIDPRCAMYFLKPDGSFASVWELWNNPALLRAQSEEVKADVSPRWTWEYRVWKCEAMYFDPNEVNGFENYSLADADRYNYAQLPYQEAVDRGLFVINKDYCAAIDRVFGFAPNPTLTWKRNKLKTIPLAYRHDGFSMYWGTRPPMTRKMLEEKYIDIFKDSNVTSVVWGVGPGSVFCYDTKVGEIFGDGLTEEQWKMMRIGDRWVNENMHALIDAGADPLHAAAERARQLGLKIYGRLEMNHEYGPPKPDNWVWVGFVGSLNKEHPEYRIPGTVLLDFKHKEVRDFKLAIFREVVEAGMDGISMDFVVYPPFFEKPDCEIMTQFIRDCRKMLDEVGAAQGRRLEIMVRVPCEDALERGLDWKRWMQEGIVDIVVVSHPRNEAHTFDINIDEFVAMGRKTGCKVYGCIRPYGGWPGPTDPQPGDEKTHPKRFGKPKTREMYYAQALMFHRAGADGIQMAMSGGDELPSAPWINDLADPTKLEFADKHYVVDCRRWPYIAVDLDLPKEPPFTTEAKVSLRIGDDIKKALREGHTVDATVVAYFRGLQDGEKLEFYVNGNRPVTVLGGTPEEKDILPPIHWQKEKDRSFIAEGGWWMRGEHKIPIDAQWLRLGSNRIRMVYSTESRDVEPPLWMAWLDLIIKYDKPE